MATIIQQRRDTAANWTSVNPILAAGEVGYETDTLLEKRGNGIAAWNALPYANDVPEAPGGGVGYVRGSSSWIAGLKVNNAAGAAQTQPTDVQVLTQAEYDALTPVATTLYFIVG